MTLLKADGSIREKKRVRFVVRHPDLLVGKPLAGDGECVALVQSRAYMDVPLPHTSKWKAGPRVVELQNSEIPIGTVIGTMVNGKWPGLQHGNHVGVYGGCEGRTSSGNMNAFVLVEQFRHPNVKAVQARVIGRKGTGCSGQCYTDPSNNADAFFIIEVEEE